MYFDEYGDSMFYPSEDFNYPECEINEYEKSKKFPCQFCQKAFNRQAHLKRHINTVHEKQRNLNCDFCNSEFTNFDDLKSHVTNSHEDKIHLFETKELFENSKMEEISDQKNHEGQEKVKKFHCDLCQKAFVRQDHLRRHISCVHKGEKDFSCEFCEKSFARKDYLQQHINTIHKDEKDFENIEMKEEPSESDPNAGEEEINDKSNNFDIKNENEEEIKEECPELFEDIQGQ